MRPTLPTLLFYALPALPLAVLYLPLFSYVTPFYVAERGVDVAALGVAWIAIRLFDAISDPAIGWLSDRSPARFGRRRLWLALSVPLLLVGTWQVFVPPSDAGLGHAVFWLFLLTLGWSAAQTPYAAWGAEIAPDYQGRTRVTAWRETLVLVGTLVATILYFSAGEGGKGLEALALIVCILLPLTIVGAATFVRDVAPASGNIGWREGLAAMRGNAPFVRLLGAWFVNGAANGAPVTLFLFFVDDRLAAAGTDFDLGGTALPVAGACLLTYFLAGIMGMPLWPILARQFGKHRVWCAAMIWSCIIFAWALTLGEGDAVKFLIISALTGLAFGADLSLPPSIQADVVDLDTKRTGTARAGLFFAIWQVATKAALALSSGLVLIALGIAGFEADGENSAGALLTLSVLYAGVPIILKLLAVAMMWSFPLDQREVEAR